MKWKAKSLSVWGLSCVVGSLNRECHSNLDKENTHCAQRVKEEEEDNDDNDEEEEDRMKEKKE